MQSGEIYLIDTSRNYKGYGEVEAMIYMARVLFWDKFEVFFDISFEENIWSLDKIVKGERGIPRLSKFWFDQSPLLYGISEVSQEILTWLGAKLLLRVSRIKNVSWSDDIFSDRSSFEHYIKSSQTTTWRSQIIEADKIFLKAYSKQGSLQSVKIIEADNQECFSAVEILWKASVIQRAVFKDEKLGVGLFRSGVKGNIPVYYIGQFLDRAGVLASYENEGVDTSI